MSFDRRRLECNPPIAPPATFPPSFHTCLTRLIESVAGKDLQEGNTLLPPDGEDLKGCPVIVRFILAARNKDRSDELTTRGVHPCRR